MIHTQDLKMTITNTEPLHCAGFDLDQAHAGIWLEQDGVRKTFCVTPDSLRSEFLVGLSEQLLTKVNDRHCRQELDHSFQFVDHSALLSEGHYIISWSLLDRTLRESLTLRVRTSIPF